MRFRGVHFVLSDDILAELVRAADALAGTEHGPSLRSLTAIIEGSPEVPDSQMVVAPAEVEGGGMDGPAAVETASATLGRKIGAHIPPCLRVVRLELIAYCTEFLPLTGGAS